MSVSYIHILVLCVGVVGLATGCETAPTDPVPIVVPNSAQADSLQRAVEDSLAALRPEPDTLVVSGVRSAAARLEPVGEREIRGIVRLRQLDAGVRVRAEIDGLRETRLHGFQVLRATSCEDADPAEHLGNDLGTPHGGPYRLPGERHVGDLGNVRGGNGDGRYDRIDSVLRLSGTHSPVGRAVVIRADTDDATSPDGSAGEILACGVFQAGR